MIENYELIEEAKNNNNEIAGNIKTLLSREMAHLLKYQYQPAAQSGSWISSILDSCLKIDKIKNPTALNKITKEDFEKCYQTCFSKYDVLVDSGMPRNAFPANNPYSMENLININWVLAILKRDANNYEYIRDIVNSFMARKDRKERI